MNKKIKEISKEFPEVFNTKMIEIRIDGKLLISSSIKADQAPKNHKETVQFLKELVAYLEAPDVEDFMVLGEQGKWVNKEI